MAALALGWSVAAVVSAASGSAPAVAMLPAGIGLALLAGAYGWATAVLMRARRANRSLNLKVRSGPVILRHRHSRGPVV